MLSSPAICYLIEILLALRDWERDGMGITNGNATEKDIPAHLYSGA